MILFQEFQMKMESLQQRREELERKEFQLKESLLKFDKFLKVSQLFVIFSIRNLSMNMYADSLYSLVPDKCGCNHRLVNFIMDRYPGHSHEIALRWWMSQELTVNIGSGVFIQENVHVFSAATKQLYDWFSPSVCLSVCLSVRPSVCLSVCHTFLTLFPSSYHHEIVRSYYQWQKWRPCKRSRSVVKGQGHRGQHPT